MTKIFIMATATPLVSRLMENLMAKGLTVHRSDQMAVVLEKLQVGGYGVVVLNEESNESAILEILELIKADKLPTLSIVLTTSTTSLRSRLRYLEAGADELMTTLIAWPEFWLRLKNLLSKEKVWLRPARKLADLTHYYQEGLVEGLGQQVKLCRKENKILECLTKFQHRVIGRTDLMRFVWPNPADYPSPDTIDVYIRRLRLKLGKSGNRIRTYRGFGYRWESAAAK